MYALIVSGGKQYRVEKGQTLTLDMLDKNPGDVVEFDHILFVKNGDKSQLGAPLVKGAKVTATVNTHGRAKKVRILKFKRRKHHMKRMGHRQDFTEVTINEIKA